MTATSPQNRPVFVRVWASLNKFRTSEHIEKCNEYNVNIHLDFIDYKKAFDSIQLWVEFQTMDNAKYWDLLEYIYERATMRVKIGGIISNELISDQRGVEQIDTISPNFFTLTLEDIFL